MRILVTGASGFIGNHLVSNLLEKGHTVIATSSRVEKADTKDWFSSVTYIQQSISDVSEDENLFEKLGSPDKMIHLAWQDLPDFNTHKHVDIYVEQHFRFLQNLISNGLRDLTVVGTCLEYGIQENELTEDMPVTPVCNYGKAKNQLRLMLEDLKQNLDLKWVRIFYMYGEGQYKSSLIPQLEAALARKDISFNMSGGEQIRDYLPVTTVADNLSHILLQNRVKGIINCCSGKPIVLKDFVLDYLHAKQAAIKINFGFYPYASYEPMRFWGNARKLNTILEHAASLKKSSL